MLEHAKSDRQVGMILVHEYSRFSRDPWRTPEIIGELQRSGVQVVSVTEPVYDVDTIMGMWMQKVTEAKNASYSMEVAFHTRKGMRQNANVRDPESGWCYKNGGKPPWGYKTRRIERVDVRGRPRFKAVWEPDTTEVAGKPVWQWARDVLLQAGLGASLDGIRDMLAEAGVSAPRGGHWGVSTLHSLLEPHMLLQYAGCGTWAVRKKRRQRWNPPEEWEVVENAHQAIISLEEAQAIKDARCRARARHEAKSARMAHMRTQDSPYLLTGGLFTCRRCGANMIGHRNRGYSYYACATSQYRRGAGCGEAVMVSHAVLEDAVWEQIGKWAHRLAVGGDCLVDKMNAELRRVWKANGGKEAAQVARRMVEVDGKIANLWQAIEDGLADVAGANARLATLQAEKARLEAQLGVEQNGPPQVDGALLARYVTELPILIQEATNEEKRQLARSFVEEIGLNPDTREVEIEFKLPDNCANHVEAATGIEPVDKSFADSCLTTWLRRLSNPRKAGRLSARQSLADK